MVPGITFKEPKTAGRDSDWLMIPKYKPTITHLLGRSSHPIHDSRFLGVTTAAAAAAAASASPVMSMSPRLVSPSSSVRAPRGRPPLPIEGSTIAATNPLLDARVLQKVGSGPDARRSLRQVDESEDIQRLPISSSPPPLRIATTAFISASPPPTSSWVLLRSRWRASGLPETITAEGGSAPGTSLLAPAEPEEEEEEEAEDESEDCGDSELRNHELYSAYGQSTPPSAPWIRGSRPPWAANGAGGGASGGGRDGAGVAAAAAEVHFYGLGTK